MIYAYILEQNIERQVEKIKQYRPDINKRNIFIEKDSKKNNERIIYSTVKKKLKYGDELIIIDLCMLSENKSFLLKEKTFFAELNIRLRILNIPLSLIDFPKKTYLTNNLFTNIMFDVIAAITEKEIVKKAPSRKGRTGGRPKKESKNIKKALDMYKDGYYLSKIIKVSNVSRSCFYLYLDKKVFDLIELGKELNEIKTLTGCTDEYILKRLNKKQ